MELNSTVNNGFKIYHSDYVFAQSALTEMKEMCYGTSLAAGWPQREVGTCLMLIVSEIAEAMEGDRKDLMDDHLPHRKMCEVELADAIIRILDLAGRLEFDIGGAFAEKLYYNQSRDDHKKENRESEHGKSY